jgi:hypothetical protein
MVDLSMQELQNITELRTVTVEAHANTLLRDGWVLLGLFDRQDGSNQYVEYHLGYPAEPPAPILG